MMGKKILALILIFFIFSQLLSSEDTPEKIAPPIGPYIQKGWDVFFSAEFLYWQAIQQSLSYAETGVSQNGSSVTSSGSVYQPNFPWKPGYRVGVGTFLPHDSWDLSLNYTYLYSHGTGSVKKEEGTISPIGLSLIEGLSPTASQATFAQSDWTLHFNVIDLELGRNFYVSRFLAIRPFAGVKVTWQKQKWDNHYAANQITINETTLPGTASSKQNQNFWGAGIRVGGDGTWFFYRSLSLYSKISVSGLWLDYHNDRKDRFMQQGSQLIIMNDLKKNTDTIKTVLELFLGLKAEWWMQNKRYHVALQGGFDEQVWVNLSQFITSFPNSSDFSITGMTLKARFDF